MKSRIQVELGNRTDLATQIAYAINDAIGFYQNERLKFNESRDITFNTVAGQEFYTSSDNAQIPTLFAIDYIVVYLGSIPWPVKRRTPFEIEVLNNNGLVRGQPYNWCYFNNQIRLGPVPDAVYPMRVAGQVTIAAPASDGEANNPWMTDAELLIRSRAKYQLYLHAIRNLEMAQAMAAQVTEATENLKGVGNRLTGTGSVTPTQF